MGSTLDRLLLTRVDCRVDALRLEHILVSVLRPVLNDNLLFATQEELSSFQLQRSESDRGLTAKSLVMRLPRSKV